MASTKTATHAACLVGAFGGSVKYLHGLVVWVEDQEEFEAGESWDGAGGVMMQRVADHQQRLAQGEKVTSPTVRRPSPVRRESSYGKRIFQRRGL